VDPYTTINVQTETADPASLLNWYKQLIALRRSIPALHDGGIVMLNKDSKDVLCYLRPAPRGSASVVIAVNLSAQPQTISVDVSNAGITATKVQTLAATDPSLQGQTALQSVTLPPFATWIGSVQ
jgi:alpha-glucosidase